MKRYAPKMKELAPRDLVARAIETEVREGRAVLNPDHNIEHVWIDLRHLSKYIHEVQIPEVSSFFKQFVNLDPQTDLCPVRPSNHYQMGGIPTNEDGEVEREPGQSIPGLFAVGECAAASFHGFNRLGTNSILELITMGKIAGERVVEQLGNTEIESPEDAGQRTFALFSQFLAQTAENNIGQIREEMRVLMTQKVGVFRTEEGINSAIEELHELKERADKAALVNKSLVMNQELIQRWELHNLLAVSMVIAQGALHRRESRGGHFREDFPERKDAFNYHTLESMEIFGKVTFGRRPVDMSLYEAKGEHFERFGLIERKY
jgi:succinate dehydrogenase / fumarate reductase flavoprotein subunit